MTHYRACENAQKHLCRCGLCGGTLHGWPTSLALARDATGAGRAILRSRAEADWEAANNGRASKKPNKRQLAAATDLAAADVTDWLADDLAAHTADVSEAIEPIVESLGNILAGDVARALDESLAGAGERRDLARGHFWCSLLAAYACSAKDLADDLAKVPDRATGAILRSAGNGGYPSLPERIEVGVIVQLAWKQIMLLSKLPPFRHIKDITQAIKILAVLICPAPEEHEAVCKCCLDPMTEDIIATMTKQRLMSVLPPGWLSAG